MIIATFRVERCGRESVQQVNAKGKQSIRKIAGFRRKNFEVSPMKNR